MQDAHILETVAPGGDFVAGRTKVYLTAPDGRRVGFTYQERFVSGFPGFGGVYDPYFVPDPGVSESLSVEGQVGRGGAIGALEGPYNPDTYILTTKDGLEYRYNQTTGLQTITDQNGHVVTFSRDGVTHSSGVSLSFERDYRGRITAIIQRDAQGNPVGAPIRYTYDAIRQDADGAIVGGGDLTAVTDQANLTTRYTYLAAPNAHFLDEAFDPNGNRSLKVAYENNRFVKIIDGLGNTVDQRDYDLENRTAVVRDGNGNVTTLLYDARGNVLEETDALGNKTVREYGDPQNPDLETKIIDRRGYVTERTYDAQGNVTEIEETGPKDAPFAVPVVTTFTYDAGNHVRTITNALNQTTTFTYDTAGHLTGITNAVGDSATFTYDTQGRQKAFTDFDGNPTTFVYPSETCPCGSPSKIIFADETYETLKHNQFGQETEEAYYEKDGTLAEITATEYDASGRETKVTHGTGADAIVTRKVYKGNLLDYEVVVNPGFPDETRDTPIAQRHSRITAYDYDADGRMIRQINPDGGVVQFRYDAQGNRVLLEDPIGNVTTWLYDNLNRVSEERDPFYWQAFTAGKTTSQIDLDAILAANQLPSGANIIANVGAAHVTVYGYDVEGNRTKLIDRDGRRREFDYDQDARMTEERWYDPSGTLVRTMRWAYDALGNLKMSTDPDSSYTYTYDTLNRVKTVDNAGTPGAPRVVLTYGYDKQGNTTSVSDNSGVTVMSEYDQRNRLSVREWSGGGVDPARVDVHYNAAGRQTLLERFAGLDRSHPVGRTVTTYEPTGQVDTLTHYNAVDAVLASYDYDYDFGGLVTGEARTNQDPRYDQTITYGYDLNGQLTDADFDTQPDEHYEYDLNGNRTISRIGTETTTYTTGPANQLRSDGQFRYEYDGEGNLFRKTDIATEAVTTYTYDHRNRLVSDEERDAGGVLQTRVRFVYDVDGRRIAKVVGDSVVHTVYNGDNAWADANGMGIDAHYLFGNGIDELLARQREGEGAVFYLTDRLGTVRDLANALGSLVNHVEYGSFGSVVVQSNAAAGDRYLFTGREYDLESGLYYYRARHFDPTVGRFTSRDPLVFDSGDLNLYRFVSNSPLEYTDPTGRSFVGNVILRSYAFAVVTSIVTRTWARTQCSSAGPLAGLDTPQGVLRELADILIASGVGTVVVSVGYIKWSGPVFGAVLVATIAGMYAYHCSRVS